MNMSKPTSYELLKDIYSTVNGLRVEMNDRIDRVEKRVDILEDFRGKILGVASMIAIGASAVFSWIWERITKA